jgi:hypothetical protein
MNTIRGFMGVAIESDATRFSGDEFAHEHWGAVRGAVRRRRAVRSAGVGSVSVVGAGALVMGVAVVPWGEFSPLAPGSSTCATPTPNSSGDSWEFEAEQWAVDVADSGTADEWAVWSNDGGVIASAFVNVDGTVRVTEDGGAELVALPDTDGRYVTALTEGGYVVVERPESDGVYVTVSPTAQVLLEQGFAPSVVEALGGSDASYSREFDCVTPSPSASASSTPAPGPSSSPSAVPTPEPGVSFVYSGGESPFQCGAEIPSTESTTGLVRIVSTTWLTPSDATTAISSQYADPDSVKLQLSGDLVPVTQIAVPIKAEGDNVPGTLVSGDPAEELAELTIEEYRDFLGTYQVGMQYVLASDGVVVATRLDAGEDQAQYMESNGPGALLYGLDLIGGMAPCEGVDESTLGDADVVAVAGISVLVGDDIDGPHYAWKTILEE